MKLAIVLALTLTACYGKSDAVKQLTDKGRPGPISCAQTGGHGAEFKTFTCNDGAGVVWACDESDCIKTGVLPAEAK